MPFYIDSMSKHLIRIKCNFHIWTACVCADKSATGSECVRACARNAVPFSVKINSIELKQLLLNQKKERTSFFSIRRSFP